MSSAAASPAAIPYCALHPEVPARTICERCGGFCCAGCLQRLRERSYCAACAALPEVNYLETLRLKFWGRRDAWARSLGLWGLLVAAFGFASWREGEWLRGGLVLAQAGVLLGCFFRQRWARWGLLGVPLLTAVVLVWSGGSHQAVIPLLLLGLGASAFNDTRNQLFFELPVKERALHQLWDRYENNPLARSALAVGVLGLLLPPLALLAVILGVVALRRVDPEAHPPIGRKAHCVGALVLGMGSLLLWSSVLWPRLLAWSHSLQ